MSYKAKYRRVWTSLGVMNALMPSLEYLEAIRLQTLNRWAYEVLVARTLCSIRLPVPFFVIIEQGYKEKALPRSLRQIKSNALAALIKPVKVKKDLRMSNEAFYRIQMGDKII